MGYFLPFYPPNSLNNENFEKMKKNPGDIHILHKCTKNHDHMLHCYWDMTCDRCNCYFSFWAIFCLFTPLTAQKIKISENKKKTWRYHHFTQVYQKSWLDDVRLLRYGVRRTDRRTDRKSDIEVGSPPKKEIFVTFYITITIVTKFEDEIVNNMAFEHANLIFTEPWVLTNEIMLNIMQNFKFDFLKSKF